METPTFDIQSASITMLIKMLSYSDKAFFWYDKQLSDYDVKQMLSHRLNSCKNKGELVFGDRIRYKAPDGNEWLMFHVGRHADDSGMMFEKSSRCCVLLNFTNGKGFVSVYAFFADGRHADSGGTGDQEVIFAFTPHLIDRYRERFNKNVTGEDLIVDLMANLRMPFFVHTTYKGKPSVALIDGDIICLGIEREQGGRKGMAASFVELKTVINKASLTSSQKELYAEAIKTQKDIEADSNYLADSSIEYNKWTQEGEEDYKVVFGPDGAPWLSAEYFDAIALARTIRVFFNMYRIATGEYPRCVANIDDCKFYSDLAIACNGDSITNIALLNNYILTTMNSLCLREKGLLFASRPIEGGRDRVLGELRRLLTIKNQIKAFAMEKQARTELGRILKNHGLTSKFEKEIEKLSAIRKDQYYAQVEGIYAISRVIPNVDSDSLRAKLEQANLEWVMLVIEKDYCGQLAPYVEKHGKDMVKRAVEYLMKENFWDSPVGDKGLKQKQPSNFDGIKAIDEAVSYLKEMEPEPEPAETPESSTGGASAPSPSPSPSPSSESESLPYDPQALQRSVAEYKASKTTIASLKDSLTEMIKTLDAFHTDNLGEKLVDDLIEENDHHAKTISDLQARNRTLKTELDRKDNENIKQREQLFDANQRAAKAEKQASDATLKLKEAERDIEALRKQLEELSKTPRAKIITFSELKKVPLMGEKARSAIIPFLEKKGIVVDMNR